MKHQSESVEKQRGKNEFLMRIVRTEGRRPWSTPFVFHLGRLRHRCRGVHGWFSTVIIVRPDGSTLARTLSSDFGVKVVGFGGVRRNHFFQKCNTVQPGCQSMCFNAFSPISHMRFWNFQTLITLIPFVIFVGFTTSLTTTKEHLKEALGQQQEASAQVPRNPKYVVLTPIHRYPTARSTLYLNSNPQNNGRDRRGSFIIRLNASTSYRFQAESNSLLDDAEKMVKVEKNRLTKIRLHVAFGYKFQCLLRVILEMTFLVLQQDLFGFSVDENYYCEEFPCTEKVLCHSSRPSEKTFMLRYMYFVTLVCIVMGIYEFLAIMCGDRGCKGQKRDERTCGSPDSEDSKSRRRLILRGEKECDETYNASSDSDSDATKGSSDSDE